MKTTKDQVLKFVQDEPELWVPLRSIIEKFPGDESQVISILNNNVEFAKSMRKAAGEELFASRIQVRREGKFVEKLLGAFKNRID
jgi:hypothetical protein